MRLRKVKRRQILLLAATLVVAVCLGTLSLRSAQHTRRHAAEAERHNVAYIKVFKTASETLSSILRRFGVQRRLSFALPHPGATYLSWPHPISPSTFILLQPGVQHPNLLLDHCIYNRTFLDDFMAKPCVFIASLREPFQQVQSLFKYYHLGQRAGVADKQDAFTAFMLNVTKLEAALRSRNVEMVEGYPLTKNIMSRVLGFREGVDDPSEFVSRIVSELDLIVISERFLESMVLLKRLMNWSLKDILFEKRNTSPHRVLTRSTAPQAAAAHRNWSSVDYLLYDAAAAAFDRRVREQDETFKEEVDEYRRVLGEVRLHCHRRRSGERVSDLTVSSSRWAEEFTVNLDDCRSFEGDNREKLTELSRRLLVSKWRNRILGQKQ